MSKFRLLKFGDRAAIVVPGQVLFESNADETVRRKLLQETDLHTIQRLPTRNFYVQGGEDQCPLLRPQARRAEKPWIQRLWCYDFGTNKHFTLKRKALSRTDLIRG